MGFALTQTVAPAIEPITRPEAKAWLRVEVDDDNDLIDEVIKHARERFEAISGRQLITATWELRLDGWPVELAVGRDRWGGDTHRRLAQRSGVEDGRRVYFPSPPLIGLSSASYVDGAGLTQTWAATEYIVDAKSEPGRLEPAFGKIYPVTRAQPNAVTLTYTAGYGAAASSVPASIKLTLRRIMGLIYDNRGIDKDTEALERAIECLCRPFWHGHLF